MKASEIREMGLEERQQKISDLQGELFNLRFQHEIGQLENNQKIRQARRDIARLQTVIREKMLTHQTGRE